MLINEDYFDDIGLTDNDIEISVDRMNASEHIDDDPEVLFKHYQSIYTGFMFLNLLTMEKIFQKTEEWKIISQKLDKLKYIFNAYGIDCCVPYIIDETSLHQQYKGEVKYKIVNFNNYKILYKDTETDFDRFTSLKIAIYFNIPKFKTYKKACDFIYILMKNIWVQKKYRDRDYIFDSFELRDSIDATKYLPENLSIKIESYDAMDELLYERLNPETIYNILRFFFPKQQRKIQNMYNNYIKGINDKLYKEI